MAFGNYWRKRMASKNKMISRDSKRRIDVITKKIGDLETYGIPSLFVYATPWTGGLCVAGDKRMASIVKDNKLQFLEVLKHQPQEESQEDVSSPKLILPALPQPIDEMNGRTLSSVIVGIGKDFGIDWKGDQPEWWPNTVPFNHPREVPTQYKGQYYLLYNCLIVLLYCR